MFLIYQIIITIIIILSPIILLVRILKKKEHPKRFIEKFCINLKPRPKGKLVWFHGASVGEILSIIPLVKKLEKNREIKTILITSSTLSSASVYKKYKSKKTIHQFFPIDYFILTKFFLNYWNPSVAIFIDSEIWPSTFISIKKKSIPLVLLNARITKRSFKKWSKLKRFSNYIFNKIDIAYPQNKETLNYLKKLNVSKIKIIGNLKFTENENKNEKENFNLKNRNFFNEIKSRKVWCASSTHFSEEVMCGKVHVQLKKEYPNLLTIIIPRHIHRVKEIQNSLENLNLKLVLRSSNKKVNKETDIFLVDTYGETKNFYKVCDTVFLGGSLIKHGGQNPIEAARLGSTIIHGPYINNFKEVYALLNSKNIAFCANNFKKLTQLISSSVKKTNTNTKYKKINKMGHTILSKTIKEINNILDNETKKT